MKFYNPFKPHIIQDTEGRFFIRYWDALWLYIDRDGSGNYWFSEEVAIDRCAYQSQTQAVIALKEYTDRLAAGKIKVNRVL